MIELLLIALSLVGLANSVYFTFAYYGRVKKSRLIPQIFCAREGSSCVTVVQTPYARVFGVPNSLLGIFYYVALIVWTMAGSMLGIAWLAWAFIAVSIATVILGFYLVYALRRILHIDCPLCYTAHAINTALLILLIVQAR